MVLYKMVSSHYRFMELDNSSEAAVYHLLIEGITCLDHQDSFLMTSALMYMVTYYIGLMVNHDINYQIIMIHQSTMLHGLSTLKEYKLVMRSSMVFAYEWDLKVVIYSLWIRLLLIKVGGKIYSQNKHHHISWYWKIYDPSNSLTKIWHMLLKELEYVNWSHNRRIYLIRLIGSRY